MIDKKKDLSWVYNHVMANRALMLFTIIWTIYIVFDYNILIQRPVLLYEPIWGFQKLFLPSLIPPFLFVIIVLLSIGLSVFNFLSKSFFKCFLLAFLVMLLNAIRWNYGSTSHVGHLFILTHLFFAFTPNYNKRNIKAIRIDLKIVKLSLFGILITYSMAGFWKFLSLAKTVYIGDFKSVSWLHKDAVELNAITNRRMLDNEVSSFMFSLYQIPYIWEIATLLVFGIQLTAVLAVCSRKYANLVLVVLVSFHLFNTFFNDIIFNVAPIVLLILLFPYHLVFKNKFIDFKQRVGG
ncbi:signal transduction histidine kinase [Wenyingzhuangia heitensis]|uniref:Signal transduction histidine kinase n=1 Tax=Wenyingzhuangia heitensis TaxID=1487859 RepID=A0ABX0U447_9FLAO|nr:hypothetical protein [Wenyingzhuangia heitensis]NIJ43642.1 signal transduction histidine kinase [Wenyingzhuangia heitensis]